MAELAAGDAPSPIRIPEWDDVLHITPRTNPSAAQRRAWNAYLNATGQRETPVAKIKERLGADRSSGTLPETIGDAELATLLRGRQIYQDMRGSQIPEWRQEMIRALTMLDNIEDQISTVEWITRPLTSKWAPTRWLSKVARRTTEVIDDLEQVLAGPTIAKALRKDRAARTRRRAGARARGKASTLQAAASWLQENAGHLLEAGQATDTWFGVGISLGAIFGAIEETQDRFIISAWEGAKFTVAAGARAFAPAGGELDEILETQQWSSMNRVRETGAPVVQQAFNAIPRPLRFASPFTAATELFQFGMEVIATPNPPTSAERALALYHIGTAGALLAECLEHVREPRAIARLLEHDAPGPRVRNPYSLELLAEAGAELGADRRGAGAWRAPRRTVRAAVDDARARLLKTTPTWLPRDDHVDQDGLLLELLDAGAEISGHLLTGRPDGLQRFPHAAARAEILLHHLELYPPAGTPRALLEHWLTDQVERIEAFPASYNTRDWLEITARHWPIAPPFTPRRPDPVTAPTTPPRA